MITHYYLMLGTQTATPQATQTANTADVKGLQTHNQAVHNLLKDISNNAEQAANNMKNKMANNIMNKATTNYIADIRNAAAAKIADNNNHAAELHQVANAVTAGSAQIQTQANNLVENANRIASQELHAPGGYFEFKFRPMFTLPYFNGR